MKKVAVLIQSGFEVAESSVVVDLMRRAHIQGDFIGMQDGFVVGQNNLKVRIDKRMDDSIREYDMLVIPGKMNDLNKKYQELVSFFYSHHKYVVYMGKNGVSEADFVIYNPGYVMAYPLAFELIELLGIDTSYMKERLMYNFAQGK